MTASRRTRRPTVSTPLRDRLARARRIDPLAPDPARTRAILAERARLLARRPPEAQASGAGRDAVTFTIATTRYAVEMQYVREVTRLADITPVPGAPPFVAGLAAHRGQMLCLVELRSVVGAPVTPLRDLSRMVVLGDRHAEFAILAESVDDIRAIGPDAVLVAPPGSSEFVRGVTADGLVVLDGPLLLSSPRLYADRHDAVNGRMLRP